MKNNLQSIIEEWIANDIDEDSEYCEGFNCALGKLRKRIPELVEKMHESFIQKIEQTKITIGGDFQPVEFIIKDAIIKSIKEEV